MTLVSELFLLLLDGASSRIPELLPFVGRSRGTKMVLLILLGFLLFESGREDSLLRFLRSGDVDQILIAR